MSLYSSKTYITDLEETVKNTIGISELCKKSIMVTGATGTIGSFLIDVLLHYNQIYNADIIVYALGRSIEKLESRFGSKKDCNLILVEYDACKPIEFDFLVDYIIHAAGNAHPAAFNKDPVGTIISAVFGTYKLLEYGRTHHAKRMLYISSGEVYGQGDLKLDSFEESYNGYVDITSPRSCYPVGKMACETLCASYSKQYGLETVIVRPCHTFGPNFTENDNRASVQFIRNALKGEDIVLKSAGTQMRSYCYISDCVSIILTVLINGESGQAYNSAHPGEYTTILGLAQMIAKVVGSKVVFENPNATDLACCTPIEKQVLNCRKIENLGWHGKYSIEKGILNTLTILSEKDKFSNAL